LAHVETLEGEIDKRVNFLTATESVPAARRFESLQTDDQDAWHAVDFHCLGRLDELLALVAVPLVLFVENLRLLELSQALAQLNIGGGVCRVFDIHCIG